MKTSNRQGSSLNRRARMGAAGAISIAVALYTSIGFAEPVDVGEEIPGPAADRAADSLGHDWIRSEGKNSDALEADELANSERQRKLVDEIARRQLGEQLSRTKSDLRTIQRILDEQRLGANPDDTVQALGVVLGDVLVAQAGFRWIRHDDERGRSRALLARDGKTIVFPVTAIARIRDMKHRPDVAGIYAELAALGGAKTR